jgi:hypothetical protein
MHAIHNRSRYEDVLFRREFKLNDCIEASIQPNTAGWMTLLAHLLVFQIRDHLPQTG